MNKITVFYFIVKNSTFVCYNLNNEIVEFPISIKKVKKIYSEGFLAFLVIEKDDKKRIKKIPREHINAPWHTKDKQIWETYNQQIHQKINK